ncbi:hypothetical protein Y032_0212g2227 [Ancylostoma ceylanicum]|nr:hypothetical protein Y032_0212g2227 [Ancylostoma ceylanicum]
MRCVSQFHFVLVILAIIVRVATGGEPPVNKMNPYDSETSSCFFQGRVSLFKKIYNIDGKICLNLYGRLELDSKLEEVELRVLQFSLFSFSFHLAEETAPLCQYCYVLFSCSGTRDSHLQPEWYTSSLI